MGPPWIVEADAICTPRVPQMNTLDPRPVHAVGGDALSARPYPLRAAVTSTSSLLLSPIVCCRCFLRVLVRLLVLIADFFSLLLFDLCLCLVFCRIRHPPDTVPCSLLFSSRFPALSRTFHFIQDSTSPSTPRTPPFTPRRSHSTFDNDSFAADQTHVDSTSIATPHTSASLP